MNPPAKARPDVSAIHADTVDPRATKEGRSSTERRFAPQDRGIVNFRL